VLKSRKDNGGKKEKEKSRVKVFTQTIIGRYLCPGSRAEIAEKAMGGNKEKGIRKRSCQATHVLEALYYAMEIV
jgi:hypothetical protein